MKEKILITGGAGYVGGMLADRFSQRGDVEMMLLLDKEPETDLTKKIDRLKVLYLQANLADDEWRKEVKEFAPTIIVHTAWQIREMYGKRNIQWQMNVGGSDKVFDLAFSLPSVKKLIYFSTVSSYGAYSSNTIEHRFKEEEGFRKSDYLYAEEKRIVEENLEKKYKEAKMRGWHGQVFVLRPAAITGPRGRFDRVRFGLQSALSGQLKGGKSFVYSMVGYMVSWVPVTKKWLRQFIHEDDVYSIVEMLSFNDKKDDMYEVFNICPPGSAVLGPDMAKAVNKNMIRVHPLVVRIAFFFMWHLTRGKIPTSKGGWKSYCYPIAVDGSKITRMFGYKYMHESKEAFVENKGYYSKKPAN